MAALTSSQQAGYEKQSEENDEQKCVNRITISSSVISIYGNVRQNLGKKTK